MSGLAPGLYLVATPIGNARDITLRALDVLGAADVLAAEDTRSLRKLMEIHGIALRGRPILPYHEHNGVVQRPRIAGMIADGKAVALTSDAGTPLVADPGFDLARDIARRGLAVTAVPGASAPLAALSLSGLPSDRFLFAGFLPAADGARETVLRELSQVPATLVFFETARRCSRSIREMVRLLGDREAALARELTKKFEEVRRGRLSDLATGLENDPARGEIVLVVDRDRRLSRVEDVEGELRAALDSMSVKDAAGMVAEAAGLPRRDVYQMALRLGKER